MFLSILLLLGSISKIICVQGATYGRSYYSSVAGPTSHYMVRHGSGSSSGFLPLSYKSDLITEESKHRSSPRYSKKPAYKGYNSDEDDLSSEGYSSDEYSNEAKPVFASKENDSREYSIGTHIRVQHPITVPKKTTIPYPTKSTKHPALSNIGAYALDISHEEHGHEPYLPSTSTKKQRYLKHFEPDPFQVISPPKSKAPAHHHTAASAYGANFNVYEPESESYENPDLAVQHLKSNLRDRYKSVASKKQIEKYIEDQEKLLDEALKLQLLNNPKFQKLLKTAEKENQFKQSEFEEDYIANVPPPFRETFHKSGPPKSSRIRRRPPKSKSSSLSKKPQRKYRSAFVIQV